MHIHNPEIGNWYHSPEKDEIFEVVAIDPQNNDIEIQYFSGNIEEIEIDTWKSLPQLTEVPAPEDPSGPYEINYDDNPNSSIEGLPPLDRWSQTLNHTLEQEDYVIR